MHRSRFPSHLGVSSVSRVPRVGCVWRLLPALSIASVLAVTGLASGCGSSDDVGPSSGSDKCKAAGTTYPTTGCGTEVGTVLANYTFTGRVNGKDSPSATTIRMSDLYDPDGKKGNKYLVINVSALWCVYCREEAKQLPALKAKYGPKGVLFMTDLAQKTDSTAADQGDVDAWIDAYALDTMVVNDPTFVLGSAFFDPAKMPLNLIVDLKTMKIVLKVIGSDLPSVTAKLDALTAG
jgi:thiol-disulfide isomerase/thioredoxin